MATRHHDPRGLVRGDLIEAIYRIDDRPPRHASPDRPGSHAMRAIRTGPSFDRNDVLRKAEEYRSRGRIRKAIREYEKILAVDPQDIDAHAKAAPLYIRIGRKDKAKASLRKVVAGYEKQGFVDKAIGMLRLALKLDRRDLGTRLHLADLYLGKELTENALKLLERARRTFRGKLFLKEALAVEGKILCITPDDFRAQVSMVRLLFKAGRDYEGRDRLRRMEAQWALKGNSKNWRKTRWLLSRHAPSLSNSWGYFISLFLSPVPYESKTRGRAPGMPRSGRVPAPGPRSAGIAGTTRSP